MTHHRNRRWQKAAVVAGSLAALAVGVAAGVTQAVADPGQQADQAAQEQAAQEDVTQKQVTRKQVTRKQVPPEQLTREHVAQGGQFMEPLPGRITGEGVTAAFYGAVTDLVPGQGSHFAGQGSYGDWLHGQGGFRFVPAADGAAPGWVFISVEHTSMFNGYSPTCDDALDDLARCQLTRQEDGSTLMTYAVEGRGGLQVLVAERYVGDIRVTVEANNSSGPSRDDVDPTGSAPVLTLKQLTSIANESWWSVDAPLDAPYEDVLPSYSEHVPMVVG